MSNIDTRYLALNPSRVTATITTSESSRTAFSGLTKGALTGLRGDLGSVGGTVEVVIYRDDTLADVLARVVLDFTDNTDDGAQFPQPVPFFEAPHWTVKGDATSDTKAFGLTLEARGVQ